MPGAGYISRETVVLDRTSATSGASIVATITTIEGEGLENFDELQIYIKASQILVGTAPVMDTYLYRAVVPNPDPDVDAHWTAWGHLTQMTPTLGIDDIMVAPIISGGLTNLNAAVAASRLRTSVPGPGSIYPGHWGKQIRIQEAMGGTVTTPAIYSIHFRGRIG